MAQSNRVWVFLKRNTDLGVFVEGGYTILVIALDPRTSLFFVQVHPFIINPSLSTPVTRDLTYQDHRCPHPWDLGPWGLFLPADCGDTQPLVGLQHSCRETSRTLTCDGSQDTPLDGGWTSAREPQS